MRNTPRQSGLFIGLLGVVAVVAWLLLFTQNVEFSAGLFEVVSAFSTTGLSLGITGQLDTVGRLLIIATMFWGRLGAITIMLALVKHGMRQSLVKYPEKRCWSGEGEVFFTQSAGDGSSDEDLGFSLWTGGSPALHRPVCAGASVCRFLWVSSPTG